MTLLTHWCWYAEDNNIIVGEWSQLTSVCDDDEDEQWLTTITSYFVTSHNNVYIHLTGVTSLTLREYEQLGVFDSLQNVE